MNEKLKNAFGKALRFGQQTIQYVREKRAERQYQGDLAAMKSYIQTYLELPAQGQAHFPTPPAASVVGTWSPEQLHEEVAKYPLSSLRDSRLSHEFGFRNAIVEKTFPCVVELIGNQGAVIGVCKRRSDQMTDVERNHFLLVELMHLYGFITESERTVHGFAVIANSKDYSFNTRFSEKRQKQRGIGLLGPYQMMPIDNEDTNSVYATKSHLTNTVSILGSAGGCLSKLREVAPHNKTAQRLLAEFSEPRMLSAA